jgi:glycine cleavage system regulatory protein
VRKSVAFYVHGDDRPGAVADILKKLADSRISLGAMQAVCGGAGNYGAAIFLFDDGALSASTK